MSGCLDHLRNSLSARALKVSPRCVSPWIRSEEVPQSVSNSTGSERAPRRRASRAILPGEEDFGLVPLEAAAAGRPTIAYAAGGALETIVDGETGTFFREDRPQALADAIRTFDPARYDPIRLRAHAEEFRPNASSRGCARSSADRRVRPTRAVVVAAAIFVFVYVVLDLNKLYALRYGADTGTFVQWLTGEAHGRGSWNGAEYRAHLQVHDSWVLLALVPLMAAFPFAQTLLIVQVLAIAGAALAICAFARECGASARGASAVRIAYLLSPSAQGIAYGNVLENVFVPLLAALGAIAVRRRSLLAALLAAQLLLGLKEDEALFVAWFGTACVLWWDRRIGIGLIALAVVNGAAFVLAEHLSGAHPSLPGYALQVDDPLQKLAFFAALLAPFAFAPLLLRYRLLLAAPLVAELAFNRPWAYPIARIGTHWTAPILAATALGAAYVVARRPRVAVPMLACAALCALFFNDTVLKIGRWPYVVDRSAYAAAAALRASPREVVVRRSQEGAYVVAASNPHVLLAKYDPRETGYCPAYNKNPRAFFASLGIGKWPAGTVLCGGVTLDAEPAPPRR